MVRALKVVHSSQELIKLNLHCLREPLHTEYRAAFLTILSLHSEECDHIIAISKPHMERSGVVETKNGGSEISDIRTSSGVFLDRGQDEVVRAIEERIAVWTLMPVGNGEGLQVLKYDPSQKYDAHWDYL